jgi:hypothetical protein
MVTNKDYDEEAADDVYVPRSNAVVRVKSFALSRNERIALCQYLSL